MQSGAKILKQTAIWQHFLSDLVNRVGAVFARLSLLAVGRAQNSSFTYESLGFAVLCGVFCQCGD